MDQKVSWKFVEILSVTSRSLRHAKESYTVFKNAFSQVISNCDKISSSHLNEFSELNKRVIERLLKALSEFEFEEFDSDWQYLATLNQLCNQWFRHVENDREFLKLYRDKAQQLNALGSSADESPLSDLTHSQQIELSTAIGFSQVPETVQLSRSQSPEREQQVQQSSIIFCKFGCPDKVFSTEPIAKRHQIHDHGVVERFFCTCCLFPFTTHTSTTKHHDKFTPIFSPAFLYSSKNIIVNTVHSVILPGTLISPLFEDFLSEVGDLQLQEVLQTQIFRQHREVYDR